MVAEANALPGVLNLRLYSGDTFERSLQFTDSAGTAIDITGWTFLAQIRESPGADLVLKAFNVTVTDAANGNLDITLSASDVADLEAGRLLSWDLQRTTGSSVRTYIRGSVKVDTDVSRSA